MGLNKKQIENIMNIVEQAGAKKQTLPTLPSVASVDPLQGLVAQKNNAVTRLENVGVDTAEMTDPRNPLEQVLNLPEEQNMFFDLLEIINRPQQALFGGIASVQKGEDFGEGFMEGLTGEEETAGGDLIRNALGRKEDGTIDWTDFAGYALDVFLDPADIALGLVTGGASTVAGVTTDLAKGANALDAGADAIKLGKATAEGAQAINNVKKTNILGIAQDVVFGKGNRMYLPQNAEEYIKILTDKAYRAEKGIQKISITDSVFRTAGSGIKVGGAFADSLVETMLQKTSTPAFDTYKAFKNQFSETMKNTAGAVRKAVSASESKLVSTYEKFTDMFKDYDDTTRALAQQAKMSVPEFQRAIMTLYEHNFLKQQDLDTFEMLDYIVNSPVGLVRYADDTQEALVQMFGKEWIDEFTSKMTQNINGQDMEFLVFDKDFWSMENKELAEMYYDAQTKGVSLLNKNAMGKYETALKLKDPQKYEEYLKIKDAEKTGSILEQEVEVEFNNLYPRESSKRLTDPKKIEEAKNKIRKRLRKTKLANKAGAEYFLKSNVNPEDLETLLADADLYKMQYDTLSPRDKYLYNEAKRLDEIDIDTDVSMEYPKRKFKNMEDEVEYNRKRREYAIELRQKKASYRRSQELLERAKTNPSTEKLFNLESPDDLDNLDGLEVNYLPKEMRKEFRDLTKLQKEIKMIEDSVTTDTILEKSKKYQNRLNKYAEIKQTLFEKYKDLGAPTPQKGLKGDAGFVDLIRKTKSERSGLVRDEELIKYIKENYFDKGLEVDEDIIETLDDIWVSTRYNANTQALRPMTMDEALTKLKSHIDQRDYDGWFRSADSGYKERLVQKVMDDPEAYNTTMNIMWNNYNEFNKTNLSFEEFLNTDIPVYRGVKKGGKVTKLDDFVSHTFDEKIAKKFAGIDGTVETITVKPRDTFGMFNSTAEYEVLVPQKPIKEALSRMEAKPIQQAVEQTVETVADATPRVPIHRFYTDEQLQAIAELQGNSFVQQGVEKFRSTITEVQKQIGIAEFGKENALIDLSMQGYATHTKTEEAKKAWEAVTAYANQNDVKGFFAPGNTRVLGTRGYQMSAVEANNVKKAYNKYLWENDEWFNANVPEDMKDMVEEFFEVDAFSESAEDSIMGLMDDKYRAINKNKRTTDMLVAMSIGNPNGDTSAVRFINASAPEPKGFVRLRKDETYKLRKVIAETKKYAGEGLYINKLLDTIESGLSDTSQLVMEKHLYNMMNIFEKDPTDALQILDKFTSLYKMLKTSNPISFNGKNVTGNMFNMWASGMSFPEVIKNWNKASDYIKKFESAKGVEEALRTPEQKQIVEAMSDMFQNGYFNLDQFYKLNDMGEFKAIKKMSDVGKKSILNNPLTEANMKFNLLVDNHARMALYIYAKENPEYVARLGFDATDPKSAMNAVRMVLFDPKDLSLWEEDYMKRLIPFYTFTRQNLAFQMKNLTKNSDKYYKAYKAMNSVYRAQGLDPEEVNQWERDEFYLPIISKKDGKYISIKTSLPFADLINLFQDPVRKVVSATNPLLKGLYESTTGNNTFTGRPIENYQGEMSSNIPFLSKKTEWQMSQTGLDVPARTVAGAVGLVGDLAKGDDPTKNIGRLTGLSYEGDIEKAKQAREYQKINALLDKIKAVKASGKEVPTLDDIASQTNSAKNDTRMAQMAQIIEMINKKR